MPKKEGAQSASGKQIRNIRNDVTSCGPRHCRPHDSQGSGRCGVSDMRRVRDFRVAPSVASLLLCVVALASVRESEGQLGAEGAELGAEASESLGTAKK